MPHFTAVFGRNGPLAPVIVGPIKTVLGRSDNSETVRSLQAVALLDTGANETCVDASVIQRLRLHVSGRTRLRTSSTGHAPTLTPNYDISLLLPHPTGIEAALTLPELRVTAVDLSREPFQILVGRDVLRTACSPITARKAG